MYMIETPNIKMLGFRWLLLFWFFMLSWLAYEKLLDEATLLVPLFGFLGSVSTVLWLWWQKRLDLDKRVRLNQMLGLGVMWLLFGMAVTRAPVVERYPKAALYYVVAFAFYAGSLGAVTVVATCKFLDLCQSCAGSE